MSHRFYENDIVTYLHVCVTQTVSIFLYSLDMCSPPVELNKRINSQLITIYVIQKALCPDKDVS